MPNIDVSESAGEQPQRETTKGNGAMRDSFTSEVGKLAAMARIVERLSAGDVRVLVGELRARLEGLAGSSAIVIPIGAKKPST